MNVETLRDNLRQPGARIGVGVWIIPHSYLGQESSIAARLDVQFLDIRQAYLDNLPKGAVFSGLTRTGGYQNLTRLLRNITQTTHTRDCLLAHTLDLLLLGLEVNEREIFWREAFEGLPYPLTKLILAIPENSSEIFPLTIKNQYNTQIAEGLLSQ